jgi:cytochrome c oxidase subunit 1/cytochrome c oxidase subunit I+III
MERLRQRPILDVSGLPSVAFGRSNTTWFANVLYMTIEGTMFALVIASYFYLRTRAQDWPPFQLPPYARYGIANAVLFLLSIIPARLAQKSAPKGDRATIRLALLALSAFAVITMVIRGFEFSALNCRWYDNAYGSAVWALVGLHTGHLITEFIETSVILAISFTDKMEGTRLADVAINSDYWYFVVITALIVDFVVYGGARFL